MTNKHMKRCSPSRFQITESTKDLYAEYINTLQKLTTKKIQPNFKIGKRVEQIYGLQISILKDVRHS